MNPLDSVKKLLAGIFNGAPQGQPVNAQSPIQQRQQIGWNAAAGGQGYTPVFNTDQNANPQYRQIPSGPMQSQPMPQPQTNQANVNDPQLADKIRAGLRAQLGKPTKIENSIPQFVEAANKYPIFKQNPYLLPQISVLESSGGENVTRENNPLNWAARIQASGGYSPNSWQQSVDDAVTAIAGDYTARPKGTTRGANADFYQKFRDTNDLKEFVKTYEPANPAYYDNLKKGIAYF